MTSIGVSDGVKLFLDLGNVADVFPGLKESPVLTGSSLKGSFGSLKKEVVESGLWLEYLL